MCSACVVRTHFILNNFSGIGFEAVPGPPGPPPLGYAHAKTHGCSENLIPDMTYNVFGGTLNPAQSNRVRKT